MINIVRCLDYFENYRRRLFLSYKNDPKYQRERLRQEELKSPSSSIKGTNLSDLSGGMGWKFLVFIIIALVVLLLLAVL